MLGPEQKKELEATLRSFVGKPVGPPDLGRDPINEPMIKQWCETMGDANPVYTDPELAAKSVHGGIVAPPLMLLAWTMKGWEMRLGYDEPTNEQQRLHKILTEAGYTGVLGTDTEQSFTRYLRPGDTITAHMVIEDISAEKATGAGVGYFITTRTVYTDQNDEEVGWETFRCLKFIPKDTPQPAASAGGSAEVYTPARIKPPMGHDNAWWWHSIAEGRISLQKCSGCGALRHPPGPMCPKCRSIEWEQQEISGRGTLHTYTVIHQPQFPGYEFPILAALVDLEEGERMVSNVVGCDPDELEIGMKLEAFIHEDEDGFKLPFFRPAS